MATSHTILDRLCGLEGINFTVTDVKVLESEIIWWIEYRSNPVYECRYCGAKHDSFHDSRWIKLKDYPYGNKKSTWQVKRMRILCTCSHSVRVEDMPQIKNLTHIQGGQFERASLKSHNFCPTFKSASLKEPLT